MYFFITYKLEAIFLIHVCIVFFRSFVGILVQCVFSQWVLDYFESFQSIRSTVQFFIACCISFFLASSFFSVDVADVVSWWFDINAMLHYFCFFVSRFLTLCGESNRVVNKQHISSEFLFARVTARLSRPSAAGNSDWWIWNPVEKWQYVILVSISDKMLNFYWISTKNDWFENPSQKIDELGWTQTHQTHANCIPEYCVSLETEAFQFSHDRVSSSSSSWNGRVISKKTFKVVFYLKDN